MRRRALPAWLLGAGLAPRAGAAPADLDALAARWQALRGRSGHFGGGAWDDDLDRWDGAKHQVMRALSHALLQRAAPGPEVLARMGAPDQRLAPGSEPGRRALQSIASLCAGSLRPGDRDELLAYAWRGQRDWLLLWLREGRLAGCGWLHDWE